MGEAKNSFICLIKEEQERVERERKRALEQYGLTYRKPDTRHRKKIRKKKQKEKKHR